MADADKEKAEKLAAARKRYEQLKKQPAKGKKAGEKSEKKKDTAKDAPKAGPTKSEEKKDEDTGALTEEPEVTEESISKEDKSELPEGGEESSKPDHEEESHEQATAESETPSRPNHGRQPSLSIQSKMRSTSFRQASGGMPVSPSAGGGSGLAPLTPDGNAMGEIYRKQANRLDELEKENKRLTKDLEASENRWRRAEEELEELRSSNAQIAELKSRAETAQAKSNEISKLNLEIQALTRQNSHLQSLTTTRTRDRTTSTSLPSPSPTSPGPHDLLAQLDSKSAAIETMELEISNLRAQLSTADTSSSSHREQVVALEEKVKRAESAAGSAQRELIDARKNLDRASEKAVREGSETMSARARIAELERESTTTTKSAEEVSKRAENLDKKLAALTTLHKDADARRREGEREVGEMRKRLVKLENENGRVKSELEKVRKRTAGHADGGGKEGELEELEDEERNRLESRVRELEGELFEAKRGIWRDKRREIQGDMEGVEDGEEGKVGSPGGGFDEVDLSGDGLASGRRQSLRGGPNVRGTRPPGGGFANVLQSGLNAFAGVGGGSGSSAAGGGAYAPANAGPRGSLDLLDDDDAEFDESAFRAAQEEEARKRVERVKSIKRGLKDWEGYRLDIVDLRMGGGGGVGEIFDI